MSRRQSFHLIVMVIVLIITIPATSFSTVCRITFSDNPLGFTNISIILTTKDLPGINPPLTLSRNDISNFEITDGLRNNFNQTNYSILELDFDLWQFSVDQKYYIDGALRVHNNDGNMLISGGGPIGEIYTTYDAESLSGYYTIRKNDTTLTDWGITQVSSIADCFLDSRSVETTLAENMAYYTDRDYTLTNVPDEYEGMQAILTPNDDRNLGYVDDYLTFTMDDEGSVYVAFDSRATSLPDWMGGFTATGDRIYTSLTSQPYLDIYEKAAAAGECFNFGANRALVFAGATVSNYLVFHTE